MTDFAVRYSFFDRALGRSGHGEAIVRIESAGDGDIDEGEGQGEGEGNGEGQGETIDLEDPEHRLLLEQQISQALTCEYPKHQHGQLVILVLTCSQVPHLEGKGMGKGNRAKRGTQTKNRPANGDGEPDEGDEEPGKSGYFISGVVFCEEGRMIYNSFAGSLFRGMSNPPRAKDPKEKV